MRPSSDSKGRPTRNQVGWLSPAENAIRVAIHVVESAGASVALTDAVTLLSKARDRVADHEEGSVHSASDVPTKAPEGALKPDAVGVAAGASGSTAVAPAPSVDDASVAAGDDPANIDAAIAELRGLLSETRRDRMRRAHLQARILNALSYLLSGGPSDHGTDAQLLAADEPSSECGCAASPHEECRDSRCECPLHQQERWDSVFGRWSKRRSVPDAGTEPLRWCEVCQVSKQGYARREGEQVCFTCGTAFRDQGVPKASDDWREVADRLYGELRAWYDTKGIARPAALGFYEKALRSSHSAASEPAKCKPGDHAYEVVDGKIGSCAFCGHYPQGGSVPTTSDDVQKGVKG